MVLIRDRAHQIKDGDSITFGNVVAKFRMFQNLDDSVISATPSANQRLPAMIPCTPDISMVCSLIVLLSICVHFDIS